MLDHAGKIEFCKNHPSRDEEFGERCECNIGWDAPSLLKIPTKMKNKKDQMPEGWKSTGRISRTQRKKMR